MELINSFPTDNPSSTSTSAGGSGDEASAEVDLSALLSNIRARYKLLCASLGVRPRLVAAAKDGGSAQNEGRGGVVEGIEGPMKGVDTAKLKF